MLMTGSLESSSFVCFLEFGYLFVALLYDRNGQVSEVSSVSVSQQCLYPNQNNWKKYT